MKVNMKSVIIVMSLLLGLANGAGFRQIVEINQAAKTWVSLDGHPLYYTSSNGQYSIDNQVISRMAISNPDAQISLSPNGEYRLVSSLQSLDEVKAGQRYSDYYVLDKHNDLLYSVTRGTASDLKPFVSAISDNGVLSLADPVQAYIYFYAEGDLVAEGQLYEQDGDLSMERNILMQWVGRRCFILLERPGFNGGPAGNSILMSIDAQGRNQKTSYLPFTYLQDFVFAHNRYFVSGYNYSAKDSQMQPSIVELSPRGETLWSNENFGHELQLSKNGLYLAALTSHESILLFDLKATRVQQIHFDHDNKVCLGMSINNEGEIALIRVPVDFFAKRNTHFAQVYFPLSKTNTDVQIDPRNPKLFQVQTDGSRFYIGTNYEWLEISK